MNLPLVNITSNGCVHQIYVKEDSASLLVTNLKANDGINMGRSSTIAEMLWVNMYKDYGHNMWVEETRKDSNSVKKVTLRVSNIHQWTKLQSKMKSFKVIFQGCFRATPNGCFCRENLLRRFLSSKTTFLGQNLISKSIKSLFVLF